MDKFTSLGNDYFKQGLRIVDFHADGDEWAGVWRPGSGAQWFHAGLSWGEFKTQDLAYYKQGLRLVRVLRCYATSPVTYAGVWRPGSGAQWFRPYMTYQTFHDYNQQYFSEGLRLKNMPLWGLCGLWVPGSGAQWVHLDLTYDEFHDQDQTYFNKGLRLFDVIVATDY